MKKINLFEKVNLSDEEIRTQIIQKCDEIKKIILAKNQEYGSASFKTGLISNYARLQDKIDRYYSIVRKTMLNEEINFESLQDTINDIAGYGIIGSFICDEVKDDRNK